MSVVVKVTCDKDIPAGSCNESVWGRPTEDVEQTLERARAAGWWIGPQQSVLCPWHAHGKHGRTGML